MAILVLAVLMFAAAAGTACQNGEEIQSTRLPGVAQDDPFVWPEPGTIVYHSLRSDVWRPIIGDGNWQKNIVDDPNRTPVEDPAVFQEVASTFQEFPFYWLGLEFQGLPLSGITRVYTEPAEDQILLMYGTCEPKPEAGCGPPLQMRVEPCRHNQRPPDAAADGVFQVRGTPAQRVSDHLLLWTGRAFVRISAYTEEMMLAAAEALVAANGQGPATPDEPLPPPSSDC